MTSVAATITVAKVSKDLSSVKDNAKLLEPLANFFQCGYIVKAVVLVVVEEKKEEDQVSKEKYVQNGNF